MNNRYTVKVITADGSIWLLDESFVNEVVEEHREIFDRIGKFEADILHDVMVESTYDIDTEDWLYPNARLTQASQQLTMLFDGVATIDDGCEDDPSGDIYGDEGCNPYANGYKRPNFEVELIKA
jgi:hypothetical protein